MRPRSRTARRKPRPTPRPSTASCRNGSLRKSPKRSGASRPPVRRRRPNSSTSIRSRCWSRSCCPRRRPTRRQQGDAARCSSSPTRRRRWSQLGEDALRDLIKTIGLFRTKAKNVIALSKRWSSDHGGEVPHDREALEALPGVGRKTANVVLNVAFGEPTIAVDTHIFRVANRTGLAPGKTPLEVELGSSSRARRIQAARASLADPARPLHLHRAPAAVREMRHRRSVQMAGEDD